MVNQPWCRRLYREEKLQVRRRAGRKRALGTRRPMLLPDAPNIRWSLDFVSDALTDGRRFRVLAVVDDYSRECLALLADTSLSEHRVVRELDAVIARRGRPAMVVRTLERVCAQVGYPRTIRVDNGSEFISRDLDLWAYANDVTLDFSRPGKPTDRAIVAPSVRARWRGASSRRSTASFGRNA